jgi:hypothetical protein
MSILFFFRELREIKKKLLGGNPKWIINALLGLPPPPLGHPPVTMMPCYLHTMMEQLKDSLIQVIPSASLLAPRPLGGRIGARGGWHI